MKSVRRIRTVLFVAMFSLALSLFSQALFAATVFTNARPVARVTKQVNNGKRTVLYGHVPNVVANASAVGGARDMGRLDPKTAMQGMRIVLRSSPEQSRELRGIIDEQQDKRTANFHQWVTPEEFGNSFGVHQDDIQKVTDWLTQQGFTVENVTKSKRVIQFSGTSGQVEQAFQTSMHTYQVKGETHASNATEISVPEALAPVIGGVNGLHNFFRKTHMVGAEKLGDQLSGLDSDMRLGPH